MYLMKPNTRFSFDPFFDNLPALFTSHEEDSVVWSPRVDIKETENAIVVHADLPGINKKDLKVNVENNLLTIQGERKSEKEENAKNYCRTERQYGTFLRTFTLSEKVKTDDIKADYKDGVLTVTLPKAEQVKAKPIEIN